MVLATKGEPVYDTSSNSDTENITTLITVNAFGMHAPPLTVFKYERMPLAIAKAALPFWGLGKTEKGWMTGESFYEYFANVFHPFLIKIASNCLPGWTFISSYHASQQIL